MLRRIVCSSLLVLSPIGAAAAQGLTLGTGTSASGGLDQRWDVACRTLTAGSTSAACDGMGSTTSTFYDAAVVTVAPSGWATAGTMQGGSYISRVADASLRGDAGNELANFEYVYRTSFTITSGSPSDFLINLTRLRFDNYWGGYRLNGGTVQLAGLTSDMGGTDRRGHRQLVAGLLAPDRRRLPDGREHARAGLHGERRERRHLRAGRGRLADGLGLARDAGARHLPADGERAGRAGARRTAPADQLIG
jgi:hypothetical protein